MKLRSLLSLAIVLAILSSCGVNDLEDRLDKVENSLGTNEPLSVDFTTTNYDDQEVAKKASFLFKSTANYTNYIEDYQDGTYYIYIERFGDVNWNEGAWIEFEYNADTEEVSNERAGVYFYNQFGNYTSSQFNANTAENTVDLTLKSIDLESGKINVQVSASTTASAGNNEYEGKPMNGNFSFSGKLEIFLD